MLLGNSQAEVSNLFTSCHLVSSILFIISSKSIFRQIILFSSTLFPLQIIQVLSAYAADMGVLTAEGNTALHYAARGGFADCCRFLAQRGRLLK